MLGCTRAWAWAEPESTAVPAGIGWERLQTRGKPSWIGFSSGRYNPRPCRPLPIPPVIPSMRVLLTAAELAAGIDRLAAEVRRDARGTPLVVVGVLTGSIVIVADLIRRLEGPVRVNMAWASSYRGTATEPGLLELHLDLLPDLAGQDVLVVDDIFDTGRTMEAIVAALRLRGAARVRSLVLLRKRGRAEVAMEPDFVGFEIPDVFVVGYGLDFDGTLRQLDHVAALEEADIAASRVHQTPPGAP